MFPRVATSSSQASVWGPRRISPPQRSTPQASTRRGADLRLSPRRLRDFSAAFRQRGTPGPESDASPQPCDLRFRCRAGGTRTRDLRSPRHVTAVLRESHECCVVR